MNLLWSIAPSLFRLVFLMEFSAGFNLHQTQQEQHIQEIPWSLEQLFPSYGFGFYSDTLHSPTSQPATVQVHHVWLDKPDGNLTIPCWSAVMFLTDQTKSDRKPITFHRHWYVGQGSVEQLKPVAAFGYPVERSSGSLLLTTTSIKRNQHYLFTCILTSPLSLVSGLAETHYVILHETSKFERDFQLCEKTDVPLLQRLIYDPNELFDETLDVIDGVFVMPTAIQGWCPHRLRDQNIRNFATSSNLLKTIEHKTFPTPVVNMVRHEHMEKESDSPTEAEVLAGKLNDHRCPIGFYMSRTETYVQVKQTSGFQIDQLTHQCIPCPENHYADSQTSNHACQPCPRHRPSTLGVTGAVSTQCSSTGLEQIRSIGWTGILSTSQNQSTIPENVTEIQLDSDIFRQPFTLEELLQYLKPSNERIKDELEAIELFLELTYLGFSDSELLVMLIVAISMAFYGFLLTTTLFFGMFEPMQWKYTTEFVYRPNSIQRVVLPAFIKFCYIIESCLCVPLSLCNARLKGDLADINFGRFRNSRLGRAALALFRETLNIYRQQALWEQLMDLRRYNRLKDLLTELTVNRVVETAELALLVQSDESIASDFVTFEERMKFKRKTPPVMRPYFRLPRHYDATFFLLHPTFWQRLHQFRSMYPAPSYPLEV